MSNIETKVENLLNPIITSLGYQIYDIEYAKEGKDYYLRIFIDKEEGIIDIDDCEKVNNAINDILDEADYIKEQYYLEVSSSGLERKLTRDWHFNKYIGSKVEAKLFKPINKQKVVTGILKDYDTEKIVLELLDDTNVEIDRKNISIIKTLYDFNKI